MSKTEKKYGYSVAFQFAKRMTHPNTGKDVPHVYMPIHEVVESTESDGQIVLWEQIREKWPQETELVGVMSSWYLSSDYSVIELGELREQ